MKPHTVEALVAFVEKAYQFARAEGKEAAVSEFNNPGGRFVEGELYMFAYDTRGNTLAHPCQPDLIGKNRLNETDTGGTAFIRELISAAQSGGGFVHYLYPDPAENFTVRPKVSFVMMVDGDWIIGSGIYGADKEDPFLRVGEDPGVREDLKSFVGEAVAYARRYGKTAALQAFNNRNGTFVRENLYIYAYDYQGTTLALPFQPQLIGTNLSGLEDAWGVKTNRIQSFLAQQGGGFIFLHYHNPAHAMTLEPKMCYAVPVDSTWWLGAGIYLDYR